MECVIFVLLRSLEWNINQNKNTVLPLWHSPLEKLTSMKFFTDQSKTRTCWTWPWHYFDEHVIGLSRGLQTRQSFGNFRDRTTPLKTRYAGDKSARYLLKLETPKPVTWGLDPHYGVTRKTGKHIMTGKRRKTTENTKILQENTSKGSYFTVYNVIMLHFYHDFY